MLQLLGMIIGAIPVVALISWLSKFGEAQRKAAADEKAEQENRERTLRAQIITTTRGDFVSSYTLKREVGWVIVEGCDSPRVVEDALKLEAAKIGANAIIKQHWKPVRETVVAGRGKRGNPYYETITKYNGEGLAVIIEPKIAKQKKDEVTRTAEASFEEGYVAGWVAIDGNNLFGTIYNEVKVADEAFRILGKFLLRLQSSPYKVQLFWDGSFIKFARATGLAKSGEKLDRIILDRLPVNQSNLTISDVGARADEAIISWAFIKSAAVVSGDYFSKKLEDALIIEKSAALRKKGLILRYQFISGEIVVPELRSL